MKNYQNANQAINFKVAWIQNRTRLMYECRSLIEPLPYLMTYRRDVWLMIIRRFAFAVCMRTKQNIYSKHHWWFVSLKFVKMSCRLVVEFSTLTGISSDDRKYMCVCVEFMHKYTMCRIKWRYKWSSHFKSTVVSFLRLSFSTYYLIYDPTLFIALFFSISLLFLFFLRRPNDTWKRQTTIV